MGEKHIPIYLAICWKWHGINLNLSYYFGPIYFRKYRKNDVLEMTRHKCEFIILFQTNLFYKIEKEGVSLKLAETTQCVSIWYYDLK